MERCNYGIKGGCPSNKEKKRGAPRKDEEIAGPKEIVISERFHRRKMETPPDGKATLWVPKKEPTEERP